MRIQFLEKAANKPELSNPIVICGLPGSALVGKVAIDHLINELSAEHLVEIYCDGMAPQIFIEENGTVSLMKNDIYFLKRKNGESPDLILYTGDSQPQTPDAEYILSDSVAEYLTREFGSTQIITLGAYVTGNFTQAPKVYGAATDAELAAKLKEQGCNLMTEGAITGMNGLLLGIAKIRGMRGYALLGETSGYALDPKASEALLVLLEKMVSIKVDMKALEDRAKEAQAVLKTVEAWRSQQQQQQQPQRGAPTEEEKKKLGYIS